MNSTPLVSVVTATYNMGHYLDEAMESVLGQDYPAIELIVVDDGSTDEATAAVLARYADDPRVVVVRQTNAGQTRAKNAGLARARGAFVGFCDADDAWLPGKLNRQVPLLAADEKVGVVYGDIELMDGDGRPLPWEPPCRYSGRITAQLLIDNFVNFSTALVRKPILDEVGGFDESLRMGIDYDLWLKVSVDHDFQFVAAPLLRYRLWEGQMSHRKGERLETALLLLRRFGERYPDGVPRRDLNRAFAHTYVTRGCWHASEGRRSDAWADFRRAFRLDPFSTRLVKQSVKAALGRATV